MRLATISRELTRLRRTLEGRTTIRTPLLEVLRQDPANVLSRAGFTPDPWQRRTLRSSSTRMLLNCSRQAGKSLTAAGLALRQALLAPGSLVLLLSPTLRQSGELFRDKVKRLYTGLGR